MTQKKATELRQEEIIEAALKLVEQQGFDNLNIAGIAAAIDLVPSAIYRHFQGKEAIIGGLIEYVGKALHENILYVVSTEKVTQKRLKLLFTLHLQFIKSKRAIPQTLFSLLGSNKNMLLKRKILAVISRYVEQITDMIAEGQALSEIAPNVDPKSAAMLFIGLIQPLVILSQSDDKLIEIYQETSWQIYWRGIAC
ncbi:Nucleoid occlusion factor SlmA [Sporomusa ovata DSM 2662]|uniref:Transcriptional regulator, TetR family n=1 Tax=Sporomusa ovata TaxID=2378 RepID=A0A0U1L5Q5_9FIRM|nr:TetR family transcriptional regulator [Sporomusa ovata]EQB24684.1 transcriptional regulator, TetR family [Sporomusa ovata DSM 2662]CQR75031.1 Transcriptional regulator, TetR family [Sporomusa ovata]